MDNYYVSKLIPLIAEAGVAAIPNPLINIVLQGRHDTFPKRRGLTRAFWPGGFYEFWSFPSTV
jgi:cytosine deaminase